MAGTVTSSTMDGNNRELVLRIRGSTRDGQIVRLKSGKCTIGSGPRCTLRLHARGVRPLHCLVLRGPSATLIRRWAPDTRLNGGAFTDAELVPGDRLGIGSIEFEVLDAAGLPARPSVPARQTPDLHPTCTSSNHPELDQIARRLRLANRQGHRRARRLVAALRAARQQGETERSRTETGLSERAQELDARQAELEARQSELEVEHEPSEARRHEVEPHADHSEQRPSEGSPTGVPVSSQEVFRRLGIVPSSPDAEEDQDAAEHEPACGHAPEAFPPASETDENEDQSIDNYMARLLERARAPAADTSRTRSFTPVSGLQPVESSASLSKPEAPGSVPQTPEEPPAETNPEPAEMAPRATAPEKTVDLSAMRELANLSAHNAIDRHARGRLSRLTRSKLVVATVALLAGGALLWLWFSGAAGKLPFHAAMVSFLVALAWGIQYALPAWRLIASRSGHLRWKAKRGDEPDEHHEP